MTVLFMMERNSLELYILNYIIKYQTLFNFCKPKDNQNIKLAEENVIFGDFKSKGAFRGKKFYKNLK